jgi:hypothetical protein
MRWVSEAVNSDSSFALEGAKRNLAICTRTRHLRTPAVSAAEKTGSRGDRPTAEVINDAKYRSDFKMRNKEPRARLSRSLLKHLGSNGHCHWAHVSSLPHWSCRRGTPARAAWSTPTIGRGANAAPIQAQLQTSWSHLHVGMSFATAR